MAWNGLFAALWSPADAQRGILTGPLADQVRFLHGIGLDGLMVLGSTGEFVHLELPARKTILRAAAEAAQGWPIIANCSDVHPSAVAELGHYARHLGIAAVAILPPWYFALKGEDVSEFLVRGAEAAGLPLVLYNYPERTGHRLSLETIAATCDRVPVVALKQSGDEFEYHRPLAELAREKGFVLITGADTRIEEAFELGATGVVSGLANAVPEWVLASFQAARQRDGPGSASAREQLRKVTACLSELEFPIDVAAAMLARGRPTGELKQVLSPVSRVRLETAIRRLRGVYKDAGLECSTQRGPERGSQPV
jgi:4-hydroxy-tetrahydrodipicolinate synthase